MTTNLRLVLRTYSALRQMSPDDIALLETLRALNEGDRELMVETLQGKATGKKASKPAPRKIQHCAVCDWTRRAALHKDTTRDDYHEFVTSQPEPKPSEQKSSKSATKSERASGMAAQLKSRVSEQREVAMTTKDGNYDGGQGQCSDCGMAADMPIHSPEGGYITYHPFRSTAPPAPTQSSANGGAGSGTTNVEIDQGGERLDAIRAASGE